MTPTMLTSKCLKAFYEFYDNDEKINGDNGYQDGISGGNQGVMHPSRDRGVLIDFFESVDIYLGVLPEWHEDKKGNLIIVFVSYNRGETHGAWDTRQNAWDSLFETANEHFNNL